jgi:hypothetical protein
VFHVNLFPKKVWTVQQPIGPALSLPIKPESTREF